MNKSCEPRIVASLAVCPSNQSLFGIESSDSGRNISLNFFVWPLLLLLLAVCQPSTAAIVKAYVNANGTIFSLDVNSGVMTSQPSVGGAFNMDFSPDGTLYAIDRTADALYRIDAIGSATLLRSLGFDSFGGGFTVSNDGQFVYFVNRAGPTDGTDLLYRYSIGSGQIETLGAITGVGNIGDIEFSRDGTLYGINNEQLRDGCSPGNISSISTLVSIDLNTLASTEIGSTNFGLSLDCRTLAASLDAIAGGTMNMIISSGDTCCGNTRYIASVDLATGQGTVYFDKPLTINGSPFTGGASVAIYSTIPIPPAVWLFGSALGMLGWIRRKTSSERCFKNG